MADDHKPLKGAHLVGNNHKTGLITRNKTQHTIIHGLGIASKNSNHLSNDNQIPEVRQTILWRIEAGIFTKRGRNPLPSVRVCHVTLSSQSLSRENHDHGLMVQKRLPEVYTHHDQ